jgi:flavodoxin
MNALVVFDTQYGNTEQVARAIATGLTPTFSVQLAKADQLAQIDAEQIDFLIVGGPTQRHKLSAALATMLDAMPHGTLSGVKVAAFDTRYRMAAWLSGSAAKAIARALRKHGGHLAVPTQSFFMEGDVPPKGQKRRHQLEHLEPGELERATTWGAEIARAAIG